MTDPIYKKEVLRLAADAVGAGRLPHPSGTGVAHNPSCGDKVTVDLLLSGGRVTAAAHDTKACVLSQASASILGRALLGKTEADAEAVLTAVKTMLEGGSAPAAPFDDYSAFDGVAGFRNRHKCVTLPIEAVLAAFRNSEARQEDGQRAKA
jgi:NifU-like protein involved in Fe-S cluster formation